MSPSSESGLPIFNQGVHPHSTGTGVAGTGVLVGSGVVVVITLVVGISSTVSAMKFSCLLSEGIFRLSLGNSIKFSI